MHLQFAEGGFIEQRYAFPRGLVLDTDGGRPVAACPAARCGPSLTFRLGFVAGEPVWPLPPGLFAEDRSKLLQATVDGTQAQVARAAALLHRIADVVVGAVDFIHARSDIAAAGRVGPEAPHIHVPHIQPWLAIYDPVRHHPAGAARARDTMRAEAAGDPEAAYIRRLPQDKLPVRRERLQPV